MKPFGPTFQYLRQEKGYPLKDVAHDIISIQTLSKFENGHADIKLSNFSSLLSRINVTYDEFIHYYNDPEVLDINRVIVDFNLLNGNGHSRVDLANRSKEYMDLYQKLDIKAYQLTSILCELYSSTEAKKEPAKINIIKNHLNTCEFWGKFEFFLFHCTSFIFTTDEIKHLSSFFLKQVKAYPANPEVSIYEFILNQALVYIRVGELDYAEASLKEFFDNPPNEDVISISYFLFAEFIEGLIMVARGNEAGKEKCQNYINVIHRYPSFNTTANQLSLWVDSSLELARSGKIKADNKALEY